MMQDAVNPASGADTRWLEQLRDIHAAPEPPFWPPAPGWWILAGIALVVLILMTHRGVGRWRIHRRRRALVARLEGLAARHDPDTEPAAWLAAVNRLLKWVAVRAFPDQSAGLTGDDWSRFLAARLGSGDDDARFAPLADGPYRPRPEFDPEAVLDAARRWILTHG